MPAKFSRSGSTFVSCPIGLVRRTLLSSGTVARSKPLQHCKKLAMFSAINRPILFYSILRLNMAQWFWTTPFWADTFMPSSIANPSTPTFRPPRSPTGHPHRLERALSCRSPGWLAKPALLCSLAGQAREWKKMMESQPGVPRGCWVKL